MTPRILSLKMRGTLMTEPVLIPDVSSNDESLVISGIKRDVFFRETHSATVLPILASIAKTTSPATLKDENVLCGGISGRLMSLIVQPCARSDSVLFFATRDRICSRSIVEVRAMLIL